MAAVGVGAWGLCVVGLGVMVWGGVTVPGEVKAPGV